MLEGIAFNVLNHNHLLPTPIARRRFWAGCVTLGHRLGSSVMSILLLVGMLSACSKDEPKSLGSAPVVVSLQLDTAMIDYLVIDNDSRAISPFDLRCQVAAYAQGINGSLSAEPVARQTVTFNAAGQSTECRMVLPSGRYRILAWADHVDAGTTADKYYNTSNLGDITFLGKYDGNNDYRNAYAGGANLEFSVLLGDTTTVVRQPLSLRSIMGKVKFISTDYNAYVEKGQNLRVLVAYNGFLPNHYSLTRGVPFDATTGVSFLSPMTEVSTSGDGQATLGYDYVMVNGEESSVTMTIGLYDDEGKLVGTSGSLNVPIKRGGISIVKGHFLTKTSSGGGVGIDPSFDGDINIYY